MSQVIPAARRPSPQTAYAGILGWWRNYRRGVGCPASLYAANGISYNCMRCKGHPGLHSSWRRWP